MGNLFTCLTTSTEPKPKSRNKKSIALSNSSHATNSSSTWGRINKSLSKKERLSLEIDDATSSKIHQHALAAAYLYHQQQQRNGSSSVLQFDRSTSLRHHQTKKQQYALPRSSSSRTRSLTDPLLQPHQLVNQEVNVDDLETKHFVLVHGGGFGAWCWYKTIALLEEAGFNVTAIDLTGSGISTSDANSITSLSQYVKPLTDFLAKLPDGDKVILAGHDLGGSCISYAMESFPSKISKAVFIAATMLANGKSTLDIFSEKVGSSGLMQQAQLFVYGNGKNHPPTAIELNKSLLGDLLFNLSPTKDVALALVAMRPIPFAPILEKLELTDTNYGSVRRFYIQTLEDNATSIALQESMINLNPPEKVFRMKGSDHCPFFSKPQALHKLLIEISKTPRSL